MTVAATAGTPSVSNTAEVSRNAETSPTFIRTWHIAALTLVLGLGAVAVFDTPIRKWAVERPYALVQQLSQLSTPQTPTPNPTLLPPGAKVVGFGIVDVEGGEIRLAPAAQGVIEAIRVAEGDEVQKDQPLLTLRSVAAECRGVIAKQNHQQAKLRLQTAHRGPKIYIEKIKEIEFELEAGEEAVEAQREEIDLLKSLSNETLPAGRLALERRKLAITEAKLDVVRRQFEQAKLRDPSDDVESAAADVAKAEALLREAEEAIYQHTLRAPERGKVLRVMVSPGQVLASGLQPALLFRPARPLMLRCEIAQEFADRVAVGQPVEIFNDKIDGAVSTGRVVRIADWIAPRRSTLDEPFERNDVRTLEAIVEFVGTSPTLRHGQRLRVVFGSERNAAADSGR